MQTLKAIVFSLIVSACSVKHEDWKEPARVNGVPEKAFWIGETVDGNWYLVDYVHDHRNNAIIEVYDINGRLVVAKRFMLMCPSDNVTWIDDLKEQIKRFDGERILLKSTNGKEACFLQ